LRRALLLLHACAQIYHAHHNDRPYVLKNYRQALLNLEAHGIIAVDPPRTERRNPHAMPATAIISFPEQRAG